MLCTASTLAQNIERYALEVYILQPISASEATMFEDLLMNQLSYFLDKNMLVEDKKISYSAPVKKTLSQLDNLVDKDIKFYDYAALKDFKGFSETVKKKLENITNKSFLPETPSETVDKYLESQKIELINILKTEIYVFSEKDLFITSKEVYTDLTAKEKQELINEIEEFKDGDLLSPIEIKFQELDANDTSGEFLGIAEEKDFADKVLDLLAENSQRLERLESELDQIAVDGFGSAIATQKPDAEIMSQLPSQMEFFFYSGSYQLSTATILQLNEIVEMLVRAPSIDVLITGYADNVGSAQTNLVLSKKRALEVKKFMKNSGISEDRFITNFFGEAKNAQLEKSERKVEIKFYQ